MGEILHGEVSHVQQSFKWDCGIATVKMALSSVPNAPNNSLLWETAVDNVVLAMGQDPLTDFGERPWTIDLCNILHRLKVNFAFFTTATDVDDNSLASLTFYAKHIKKDKIRVDALLQMAYLQPYLIQQSLTTTELIHLLKSGPLILLVNYNELNCVICNNSTCQVDLMEVLLCWSCTGRSFLGHYVVIVGYSAANDMFFYRNPALPNNNDICQIKVEDLTRARCSKGTDEDVIAVSLHGNNNNEEPLSITAASTSFTLQLQQPAQQYQQ